MPNIKHIGDEAQYGGRPNARCMEYAQVFRTNPTKDLISLKFGMAGRYMLHETWEALAFADGHVIDLRNDEDMDDFFTGLCMDQVLGIEILNWLAKKKFIDPNFWDLKIIWAREIIDVHSKGWLKRKRIPLRPTISEFDQAIVVEYVSPSEYNSRLRLSDSQSLLSVTESQDSDTESVQRIGEDNIEENRREGEPSNFPSLENVINYFSENNYSRAAAIKFFEVYDNLGWFDKKGNQIKNWKMKAQKVWFTPEHKNTESKPAQSLGISIHTGFKEKA